MPFFFPPPFTLSQTNINPRAQHPLNPQRHTPNAPQTMQHHIWLQKSPRQRKRDIRPYKRHGGSVKEIYDHTSVTAAASHFQRGATIVAGYVSRWRSQHKSIRQCYSSFHSLQSLIPSNHQCPLSLLQRQQEKKTFRMTKNSYLCKIIK